MEQIFNYIYLQSKVMESINSVILKCSHFKESKESRLQLDRIITDLEKLSKTLSSFNRAVQKLPSPSEVETNKVYPGFEEMRDSLLTIIHQYRKLENLDATETEVNNAIHHIETFINQLRAVFTNLTDELGYDIIINKEEGSVKPRELTRDYFFNLATQKKMYFR